MPLGPLPIAAWETSGTAPPFFGSAPVTSQPVSYTAGYATTNRAMGSYTPNAQGTAYVVGVLNLLAAAQGADVNTLRVAYENLRVFCESMAQQHNALIQDLKAYGMIG